MTKWNKYPETKPPYDETKHDIKQRFLVCIGNTYIDTARLYPNDEIDFWKQVNITHWAELPEVPNE